MGVIDAIDLVVGPGLTALTGETGAGKTMLVEAIALLLGGRADPSVVRHGSSEARVEGRFVHGDEEFVVCRVIPADGRSRTYVNGRLATVASLAELTGRWVDLHGQHAQHGLLEPSAQRDALDRWAGTDLAELRACHARLVEIDAELAALGGDERSRAHELDLLRFQTAELDQAGLGDPAEDEFLAIEYDTLSSAVELQAAGRMVLDLLRGDGGATDRLGAAAASLGGASVYAPLAERLAALVTELDDLTAELRHTAEGIEDDPQRLDEVRQRRQLLRDLQRKYGDSLADVLVFHRHAAERLAELEGYGERAAALGEARGAAVAAERQAAAALVDQARGQPSGLPEPWASGRAWRLGGGEGVPVLLAATDQRAALITVDASSSPTAAVTITDEAVWVTGPAGTTVVGRPGHGGARRGVAGDGTITSPMPGTVVSIAVEVGQRIDAGAVVAVVEAMKMEHRLEAPFAAEVVAVEVGPGEQVALDQVLVRLEEVER